MSRRRNHNSIVGLAPLPAAGALPLTRPAASALPLTRPAASALPLTALALLALLVTLAPAIAEQPMPNRPAGSDSSGAVRFRRVYVPEDQIDAWPRHGVRYLPMDAAEFERLAGNQAAVLQGTAGSALQQPGQPPNVEIIRGVYEAELAGDVLSRGEATLEIRHAEKVPSLLRMDSCRLPIQSPRWLTAASKKGTGTEQQAGSLDQTERPLGVSPLFRQPATLGIGPDGRLVARVEKSGTLQFDWSLIGRRETGAALVFDLGLPHAPSNELRLALPADLVPSVEQGFVTLVAGKANDSASAAGSSGAAAVAANKNPLRHWDIELGGQTQVVLRLARHDFLRESRPLTLVRQSLAYDFSPRGMQLSADLKLDVLGEPIERIGLLLDSPLELVTARYGGVQLPWFETDAAGKKLIPSDREKSTEIDRSGVHRVVIELPEPLHGTGRILRLGFVAPLVSRGRLPTIRPADAGLFWQEGSASLLVPLPLELDELTLHGCRQTKAEPLPAPSAGDAIALQYFRPDADVNIALARGSERLRVQSGTMIDVRGGTMTGRCLADLSAEDGEFFKLSADVSPSWIIDSVETVPADSLADWSYSPASGSAARLDITLAKSIRPDRPLRLIVAGRWRSAPRGKQLRSGDLQMVRLRGTAAARAITAVHPAAPYRLQTSGAESLHRLDSARLSKTDAALLGGGPIADGTLVLVDDQAADDLTVTLANETPRFSGTVRLDAQVSDSSLVETYRIRCKPESAELDRLLVHFSRRRDEPVHWNLAETDSERAADTAGATGTGPFANGALGGGANSQDQLSARRLSAVQQAALGLAASGEVWELTFRRPGSKPLEIQATRTSALAADTPILLAELVQASEQQGSLAIWATGRRIPQINNRRLTPVPIEPNAADSVLPATDSARSATELAAFQYDPVEEIVSAAVDPTPSIMVSPGAERPAAWAWSCRLDSYFSPDGSSQHFGCWRIENAGRTRIHFQMPTGATFHSAWIDGVLHTAGALVTDSASAGAMSIDPAALTTDEAKSAAAQPASGTAIKLELPADRRFVRVVLQWSKAKRINIDNNDPPLGLVSSRAAQLPEIDMPVMARQWHVWLPPRFRLSDAAAESESALPAPVSWSQRLFGPFGKSNGQTAFNPLRGDEWIAMARHLTRSDPSWLQAELLVDRLSRQARSASPTTWGKLLADAQSGAGKSSAAAPLPLLIDALAMADIGLSPRSPVRAPPPDVASDWPLSQVDLVLLVDSRAIVVTTRSAAAVWNGPLTMPGGALQQAPPGPFAEELQQSLAGSSERFVSAELWNLPGGKSPWAAPSLAADAPAIDHAGWIVYDLDLSAAPRQIGIVDRDMMLVVGCGLFLLTLLLVFAKGDVSWKRQGIALTAATAVALLLPSSCAPLGAGLWCGLAGGWTLRWLARWDRPLGPYSLRLLAAIAGSEAASGITGVLPSSTAPSDSGDTTLLSTPVQSSEPAARSESNGGRGTTAPLNSGASSVRRRNPPTGPTLGILLLLACLVWHDAGAAEPVPGDPVAERAKPQASDNTAAGGGARDKDVAVPEVLIPSDDQQRFKGKVYLVPEGLYRDLVRNEQVRGGQRSSDGLPENWLITDATYRGGLMRQQKTAALDTTDWSAEYDLEVTAPIAHVWIPLGDTATPLADTVNPLGEPVTPRTNAAANPLPVNLLPDGVRVDGRIVQFQWEGKQGSGASGQGSGKNDNRAAASVRRGVAFEVSAVGHHQVTLAFRPTPQERAGAATFDFGIPPLATSRLELSLPADVPVEIPGARGQASLDGAHDRLTESIGPVDRLTIRAWSDPAGGAVKPPVVDVDELYWLKVRPGSVVLEAKFNVRVAEGRLTQLRLLEDPRLRRLPLEAGSPISELRTEEGDLHTIYVGLAQPVVDRTTFKLSFLLTDTSGIGNLRLPKLEAVGVRSADRRLAVSVEAPLEFDPPSAGPAAALLAAQFLSAWGPADSKPQLTYKLPPGDITWNLPIHSRQPQLESREQLAIAIERGQLHESWLADLTVRGGTVFQIQVPAPPQWIVEQALLRQEGAADQAVRCARAPGGGLTLFLPGPAPEHSQLLLRGSMPYSLGAATELPEFRIRGPSISNDASQTILLLRGADVQVTLSDAAGLRTSDKAALQAAVDRALTDGLIDGAALGHLRPTVCLSGHSPAGAKPAVRVAANAPRIEGKEMTTLRRAGDAWNAAVDLDLHVSNGVLDELRFDLPPQWSDPTEVDPSTPSQLIDVPGENRRQLLLRPAEPWTGAVRLHLSGPINVAAGQRVRVPDVRPVAVGPLHRYVLLPTRSGEQNLSWEATGLNFEPLPKRFSPESSQIDLYRTCEVVAEHFDAALKSVETTIGQPRVRLADIAVAYSGDRHCCGTATFDLDPAGALNCLLELAPNEHLLHVRADGIAAAARPVGENHWSVALGDGKLPQRIEVVFTADLPTEPAEQGRLLLSAPVLVDLPVEQTLWTVAAPSGDESGGADLSSGGMGVAGAARATEMRQDRIRLDTISQLLESSGGPTGAEPDDQIANWLAPWTHRWLLAQNAIDRWREHDSATAASHASGNEIKAIVARQKELAHRLGIEGAVADEIAAGPVADEAFDLWKQADGAGRHVAGFYVHGFGPTLALTVPRRGIGEFGGRLIAAILGAAAVGLVFWGRPRAGDFASPWSAVVGRRATWAIAAGLFWWLEMEPSGLGLLIVAIGVATLLRRRRIPLEIPVATGS